MSDESRSLYSPLSISRELLPWAVWIICLLTIIWTALTAWGEVSSRRHADILDTALAVGSNAADSVPLIIIYSIMGVMVGNFILGGGIMIMARATKDYLYGKIERQRERLREEGRTEGRDEGRTEGRDEGRAEGRNEGRAEGRDEGRAEGRESLAAEIESWNRRRLEAERRGQPFDEPPPSA